VEVLHARAKLLRALRSFFEERGSLEVETPGLVPAPGIDAHIDAISAEDLWLTTSPEYHMKRLLCAGSGPIHQIGKAWRRAEVGRHHEPEFTLLEWYSPGVDDVGLMDATEELVKESARALGLSPEWLSSRFARVTWAEAFAEILGYDVVNDEPRRLGRLLRASGNKPPRDTSGEDLEDLALCLLIQPKFQAPTFLTDWPAPRAALAQLKECGRVAGRFELYLGGHEICNGYHELGCAVALRTRMEHENRRRTEGGKTPYPIDEGFLSAIAEGMPDCAGNALGVDRLLMALLDLDDIGAVRAFRLGE
jgi:elongation factor P--(R)-beta-lysine ligase